ncbi:MAG: hypothetical protein WA919_11055 [Coleofasciculaceae cyanobacterium]
MLKSDNIKKFSGKRVPKGADPNLSRVYTDRLLGSRYQFRLDRATNTVYLIVHQSGKTLYPKGRSLPIGTVSRKDGTFCLDLLVGEVPIYYVCRLVGSNIESLQAKAIAFIESLNLSKPRQVKGEKAVKEKRARRSRRILKGVEIR